MTKLHAGTLLLCAGDDAVQGLDGGDFDGRPVGVNEAQGRDLGGNRRGGR